MRCRRALDLLQEEVLLARPLVEVRCGLADHACEVGCTQDDRSALHHPHALNRSS
jgi:hypothetical protein